MKKDYTKKAVQGSIIIFIFSLISVAIGFFLRTFLAKNLTVAEYGLLYAVMAFFGLFAMFRDFGLNPALVKYIPEFLVKKDYGKIKSSIKLAFIIQVTISTVFFFCIIYFSQLLAEVFFKAEASTSLLFFIGLSFVSSVLFHLVQSIFQGFQKMKFYAMLDPIRTGIVLVVAFFAISLGYGITGIAFGYFIAGIATGLIGFLVFLRTFPFFKIKSNINNGLRSKLFSFAIPVVGGGVASIAVTYIDTIMITYFRTLDEVGYYQVALPISDLINIFAITLSIVTFPMVSELWARKKNREIIKGLSTLIKFSLIIIALPSLIIFVFSETIIGMFFGAKYLPAVTTLRILVLAVVFQSLTTVFFAALKGIGRIKEAVNGILLLAMSVLIFNFILVQKFGIVGTSVANLISYFITMLFTLYILRKNIALKVQAKDIIKIALASLFAISIGYYMKTNISVLYDIPSMGVCLFVYLASIIVLGVIKKDDMKMLEKSGIKLPSILHKMAR